jgi:hypothetical protein
MAYRSAVAHDFDRCDERDALLERVDDVCRLVFEQLRA